MQTRNTEASLYWNRYNVLGALALGFTVAGLSVRPDSAFVANWKWASAAGLALSFLWFFVAVTGRTLIEYWNDQVIALEDFNREGRCGDWRTFSHLKNSSRAHFYRDRLRSMKHLATQPYTYVAACLPLLAMLGWVLLLLTTPPLRSEIIEMQKQVDQLSREISGVDRSASARIETVATQLRDYVQNAPTRSELVDMQRCIDLLGGPKIKGATLD